MRRGLAEPGSWPHTLLQRLSCLLWLSGSRRYHLLGTYRGISLVGAGPLDVLLVALCFPLEGKSSNYPTVPLAAFAGEGAK